jgi:alkylation response protein AidB-like acyl-CoA dehydrogenase
MLKVLGTETLDFCVDEGVQIHGGYGFLQDYPIERAYRDSRINRLFEGTNEINRLLAPTTIIRKARRGEMTLDASNVVTGQADGADAEIANLKQLAIVLAGKTCDRFGADAEEEQEVLAAIGDILIETYAAESAVIRAEQTGDPLQRSIARVYLDATLDRAATRATTILPRVTGIESLADSIETARRLASRLPHDGIAIQREIADVVLASGGYPATAQIEATA